MKPGINKGNQMKVVTPDPAPVEITETIEVTKQIDLQPVVDNWTKSVGGTKSVLIYDPITNKTIASYNPEQRYNTASLCKLFVVYEGYLRIENGTWNGEDYIMRGKTRYACLDLAIRESNSPCAESLWNEIGHAELDRIIKEEYGITNSLISSLTSTPGDILKIMQMYYKHEKFSDGVWNTIKDSMLNQPVTTYDWRRGLPKGFSNRVDVYNKVGWKWGNRDWDIYHDAAILDFKELDRKFIVVVMTNHVASQKIAELGTAIENAVYAALNEEKAQ